MTRADWQRIAEERAKDAQALITASQWSGAFHLAGNAVECGVKSCVLRRLSAAPELIFLDKRFSEKCWTHDLEDLIELADLVSILSSAAAASPALDANWRTVAWWSELDRYRIKTEIEARKMVVAVTDSTNGVLTWIKGHW